MKQKYPMNRIPRRKKTMPPPLAELEYAATGHVIARCTWNATRDGIWSVTVPKCPFCGERHLHGGCSTSRPVQLDHRCVHCDEKNIPADRVALYRRGYILEGFTDASNE